MNIENDILSLIKYSISKKMIQTEDFEYTLNQMTYLLQVDNIIDINVVIKEIKHISIILDRILDYSYNMKLFTPNTIKQRDLFESRIMDIFSMLPSSLNRSFYHFYKESPKKATDFYYGLCHDNNYIKSIRTDNNVYWESITDYGLIGCTINLSKPEKDPRDIIKQANKISTEYPQCFLCKENVGFYGNSTHPGRSNHRVIKLELNHELFYFQYSPYVYYNEHSIIFMDKHIPMNVSIDTFRRLFDFVDMFPHYFLGSNAGLPIVGGSILSHEHYQGGKHHFPIEDAKIYKTYELDNIKLHNINWPISVIRLESNDKAKIIDVGDKIFKFWENYSNESIGIFSYTSAPHNAITPIARKSGDTYFLDIALRNNLTSKEYPLGIFHTHKQNHNIKKENIGLIEVMGLAVLPARLKEELEVIKKCVANNNDLPKEMIVHEKWLLELKENYNNEEINKYINDQVALKFINSLENAAVFKNTENGRDVFSKFMDELVISLNKK